MSVTSDSDSSSTSSVLDEQPVTFQTFYPGQIVIAREFPEGSLRVSILFMQLATCNIILILL
jgi:hypothetical protein